jgi:hypothetical protein
MSRRWFRAHDGGFYRNAQCVAADRAELARKTFVRNRRERLRELDAEWTRVFWQGVVRKPELEPGDVEVQPVPFRTAYPNHPGLWVLDGEQP